MKDFSNELKKVMDFESAMQTFAEAWVAANASLKGQQLHQQQQQQQQQQQNESRESTEVGSSQPLRPSSRLMEADQVRSNERDSSDQRKICTCL